MITSKPKSNYRHMILFHKEYRYLIFNYKKLRIIGFRNLLPVKFISLPGDAMIVSKKTRPGLKDLRLIVTTKRNKQGKERYVVSKSYVWHSVPFTEREGIAEMIGKTMCSYSAMFALVTMVSNHFGKRFNDLVGNYKNYKEVFKHLTIIRYDNDSL